ncbi:hypothetical protein [Halioxenophilus aromaticivorans]|uniref:DUF7919 domain-containing protein n=1 Tax=Halioxenophilus aromaticivorans TaxID=1306992 RepID=A0AAV3U2R5_9ALTE
MYFEDLSDYSYHPDGLGENVKNIGWLCKGEDYNVSENPHVELAEKLLSKWHGRVVKTRGFHYCDLCETSGLVKVTNELGQNFNLGSAEFRVPSMGSDTLYAAPDLIIHYILEHNYSPPQDFCDSVLSMQA